MINNVDIKVLFSSLYCNFFFCFLFFCQFQEDFFHGLSKTTGISAFSNVVGAMKNHNFQTSSEIAIVLYHLYKVCKSLLEISRAWEVLKEEKELWEIVADKAKNVCGKLDEISGTLDIICKHLSCPSPRWKSLRGKESSFAALCFKLSPTTAKNI